MADTRKGLNAQMSYQDGSVRKAFSFRCSKITKGFEVIAQEEEARNRRAMYPHAVSPTQFVVSPLLKGYTEFKTFMDWLREYAEFSINPDPTTNIKMTVVCPARSFAGVGTYRSGISYGDSVGRILWEPDIVFESAYDPNEKQTKVKTSYLDLGNSTIFNRSVSYFYPASDAGTLVVGQNGVDFTPVLDSVTNTPSQAPSQSTQNKLDNLSGN